MGIVFRTGRARLLTAVSAVALLATLAGCDNADKKQSSADLYKKAVEYRTKGDLASSLIELKNALQADPKNGPAHLLRAEVLMDAGDSPSAEDELRAAAANGVPVDGWFGPLGQSLLRQQKFAKVRDLVAQNSTQPPSIQAQGKAFLGTAALADGNVPSARQLFEQALAVDAQNTTALLGMVRVELSSGNLDKAAEWQAKALAVAPNDPETFTTQAALDNVRKDPSAMEASLRKAVAVSPANPFYRVMLAQALVSEQKNDEADTLLKTLLKQLPNFPLANHLEAILLFRAGKFKEADTLETNVLSNAPNMVEAQFLDGLTKYSLGQYAPADNLLNGIKLTGTAADEANMIRGAALLRLGRAKEGYRLLQPLVAKFGNNVGFLQLTAAAAQASNDLATSRDLYQRASAAEPKNVEILTHLASIKLDLGDTEGGKANLNDAFQAPPSSDQAMSILFSTLLQGKEFDKAMELAKKEQAAHPTKPQGWVMSGMVQALQSNATDAIGSFTKALQIDPSSSDAVNNLASIYLSQGRIDLARSTVEDGYKHSPKNPAICAMGSKIESAAKNPAGMQVWLERDLEIEPQSVSARATLVQTLIQTNQPQKAVSVALTGLQTNAGDPAILKALAQAYIAANRATDAASTLRDLVTKQPNGDNYYLLALVYFDLNDQVRLRETLETLVKTAPDFRPGRILLARVLLGQKDTVARADSLIATLASEKPDDPDVIELQARLAAAKGNPQGAVDILEKYKATQAQPSSNLILLLSSAYWDAGQHDKTVTLLSDWSKAHPDDAHSRMTLASRQIQTKQYDDARKTLSDEIKINPSDWVAQNNLAWVLMTQGDLTGAQQQIESAHKLAGTQPDVLDTEGQIALARGNASQAVDLLKLSVSGQNTSSAELHLARALIATGKTQEARDALKSALATANPGPDADEAKALLASIKK